MSLYQNRYRPTSIRFPTWDYACAGYYFVTLCSRHHQPIFGEIIGGEIVLSPIGEIAERFWLEIPAHFPNTDLDEFVIMPNHVHGIIILRDVVAAQHAAPLPEHKAAALPDNHAAPLPDAPITPKHLPAPGSLSAIIRSYKSAVTRWAGKNGYPSFAWQPRFYDHIIRNEQSLQSIRLYIRNNPLNWALDEENPTFLPR